jgi:hypothetical protein
MRVAPILALSQPSRLLAQTMLFLMQQSLATHALSINMCAISMVDYMAYEVKKGRTIGMVGVLFLLIM